MSYGFNTFNIVLIDFLVLSSMLYAHMCSVTQRIFRLFTVQVQYPKKDCVKLN